MNTQTNQGFSELSLEELRLCIRLTQHVHQVEYDEFWCITQYTREDLASLLEVLDLVTDQWQRENVITRMSFSSAQHSILIGVFWYACNFDDFFETVVDEAEFEEVWALYAKLERVDAQQSRKKEPDVVNVGLNRKTLTIVVDVFLQMLEQRDEIDFGMMDLAPFTEFEALVERLVVVRSVGNERNVVPMSTSEWHAYTSYIKHSHDLVLDYVEGEVMGDLALKYRRRNRNSTDFI